MALYPCFCVSSQCNGKPQKYSTRNYHQQKDQKLKSTARLELRVRVPNGSVLASGSRSLGDEIPQVDPSHQPVSFTSDPPFSHDGHMDTPPALPPPSTTSVRPVSGFVEQAAAEARGEAYIDDMPQHTNGVPAGYNDDGWDDLDLEDSEVQSPGAGSGTTSASVHMPIPPPVSTAAAAGPVPAAHTSHGVSGWSDFVDPGDPALPNENIPDPFCAEDVQASGGHLSLGNTPVPVYMLYLLVAWLHTHFHLPFLACNAVLTVVLNMFSMLGITFAADLTIYCTLTSVITHIGIEPHFLTLPVCPDCLEVHPAATAADSNCAKCGSALFQARQRLNRRLPEATNAAPRTARRPHLQFPIKSIESQLRDILSVPGMGDVLEQWRYKPRCPQKMTDNFDGDICKSIPGPDGRPFFENPCVPGPPELRIGVTLGVDWFSYLRSQIAPSHTSGPMCFNIINLPHHLRYRTSNIILAGILPGPKEQNPDQIQRFLRPFVNELIRLWRRGFLIKTSKHPNGILVRVILVCVICDKPAAHKMGGFGSHSHTFFCTRCWIKQADKGSPAAFAANAFRARSHSEQLRFAEQYAKLRTQSARDDFVKQHASRWFELARLPYFDVCRMIVIDPMHNLLLGLVKTHFYHIWIQQKVLRKTRELRRLQDILSQIQIPAYLGRLPPLMGIPAGGSLTADQWLLAATVVCPLAIPQIWDEYCTGDAEEIRLRRLGDIQAAIAKKKAAQAAAREARKQAQAESQPRRSGRKRTRTERGQYTYPNFQDDDPNDPALLDAGAIEEPADIYVGPDLDEDGDQDDTNHAANLHPHDPSNFSKLTLALHLLLGHEISLADIDRADQLLRGYCTELISLYGADVIRPNHHYCTHIAECIHDYGPLHGFWSFLFERINKVLKSYNSSNHSGGELETSFFREFHRTVQQSRMMASAYSSGNGLVQKSIHAMYRATSDDRGTVQALARDLDNMNEDGGLQFQLSPMFIQSSMGPVLYNCMLSHLRRFLPFPLRSHISLGAEHPLHNTAIFFDYVVISQRRYYASGRNNNLANSLVAVSDLPTSSRRVAELLDIIALDQAHLGTVRHFAYVRYLVPCEPVNFLDTTWSVSNQLDGRIGIWKLDEFDDTISLIPLHHIRSHVVRTTATILEHKHWVTIFPT